MNNRLFLSVATVALIAATGLSNAQTPGGGAAGAGSAGGAAAPAERAAPSGGAIGGGGASDRDAAEPRSNPDMKSGQANEMKRDGQINQRAQDNNGQKKGMDADGRDRAGNDRDRNDRDNNRTTGQAGAGGKLTTEQRSRVTTVIRQQNIRPQANVNFAVSIGTRVPRDVRFYPLPTEIVSVYPDWRGYEFFLVGNDIIVVNPRTLEIVAVLDA